MNELEVREQFLNYQTNLINKVLGINFEGSTIDEKEAFYQQHKEPLKIGTDKILNEMHTAFTARVIRFGNGSYETDWVVAESKEEAFEYFKTNTKRNAQDMDDIEIHEVDTELEFLLFEQREIPESDWNIFKKSEENDGFLEVPFIYAIDYALQNGMKLPNIIQSFE